MHEGEQSLQLGAKHWTKPGNCGGKPGIRGMSASHPDRRELFHEYPFLEEEDLQQALRYAAASVDDEIKYAGNVA